ncbi:MAG: 30S ribosomal protein S12 methylthiotransferase RimO [Candidatus Borkfalkiaceae bacterium]|nr:30S ribosomal protein S12 methylthiotransferase RimO [Christensenellaceae bacterium]
MTSLKDKKIAVISLGCDKNRVDTEKMLGVIEDFASLTSNAEEAEIIIINTCAFLASSRKEAIETIIEFNGLREAGKLEKLVVTGCLPQKFIGEIFDTLTEADVFLGFLDYDLLKEALIESYETGERVNYVGRKKTVESKKRIVSTPLHYAYLKIADGCNNRCTYCLIPYIRGKYVSVPKEDLIKEASSLGDVSELILVAQDITRYGEDLYGKMSLVELIKELSKLENIGYIRLLYCYPDVIDDELIGEIRDNPKVVKYIDIPLQHADDAILKTMNRKGNRDGYLSLINKLKTEIPGIAIRSTFIAGFPGEDEQAFENLKSFLSDAKLFNAGFFAYSREEGTPAYKLKNQVSYKIKQKRVKELYSLQKNISKQNLSTFKGKVLKVLCDGINYDKQMFEGRAYFNAPDIDGKVYFTSESNVEQGKFYEVFVERTDAYDLYGRIYNELT